MTEVITPGKPGAEGAGPDEGRAGRKEPAEGGGAAAGPPRRRRLAGGALPVLLAFLAYAGLALWLFHDAWASPATVHIKGGSDPGLFVWFLDWTAHAVTHGRNPLFSNYVNVPDGVNLMWNTSMILPGLVLTPVTRVWGPVVTYNLLMTASIALSAWAGYLAARRFVRSDLAAAAGGLVYGFSPAILAQARGHLHLTVLVLPPLILLLVHHALVRQRRPAPLLGALLGGLAACQLLIGEEVLAFTAIACAILLVALVALNPGQVPAKAPYAALALGTAAVVAAALVAYPLWVQLAGPQRIEGDIQSGITYSNDLANLVVPTDIQRLRPPGSVEVAARFPGTGVEQNGYVGVPMLLIAALAAAGLARRRRVALVAGVVALVLVVASLGATLHVGGRDTGIPLPWGAVHELPLLESALPNRFTLLAWLFIGLLLALFVDWAIGKGRAGRAAAIVGVAAVVATLLPSGPVGAESTRIPPFFAGDAVRRIPEGSAALILPMSGTGHSEAMLWQAQADMRFRMPGGYFVGPRSKTDPRPAFGRGSPVNNALGRVAAGEREPVVGDPRLRERLVDNLETWDIRTIVLGPMPARAGRVRDRDAVSRFLTDLLRRKPEEVGGVQVWWNVDPATLR